MSSDSVLIRPARNEDLDALVRLLGELFAIEDDFLPDPERQRAGLAGLLATPSARVFVADHDGAVIGMCTVQTLVSTAEGGNAGLVEDVIVDAGHRGRGTGRRLLAEVERWAGVNGIERLQLLVEKRNADALAFYACCGWDTTGLGVLRKRVVRSSD